MHNWSVVWESVSGKYCNKTNPFCTLACTLYHVFLSPQRPVFISLSQETWVKEWKEVFAFNWNHTSFHLGGYELSCWTKKHNLQESKNKMLRFIFFFIKKRFYLTCFSSKLYWGTKIPICQILKVSTSCWRKQTSFLYLLFLLKFKIRIRSHISHTQVFIKLQEFKRRDGWEGSLSETGQVKLYSS